MGKDTLVFDSVLQTFIPLNRLTPEAQRALLEHTEIIPYEPGCPVFREGDRDSYAYYLLEGDLELCCDGQVVSRLRGGTPEAAHALAQLQPRQLTAIPKTAVRILRLERQHLASALDLDEARQAGDDSVQVNDITCEIAMDWMTRMLQSGVFSRLPVASLQRIFAEFESIDVAAGDLVVSQGQPGDYYYVVQEGRFEVLRHLSGSQQSVRLATLEPGVPFGEEALISGGLRNASVKALSDGKLMRLGKFDFIELIKKPIAPTITLDEAREWAAGGATWLDARYPDEHAAGSVPGSMSVPLHVVRSYAASLDRNNRYLIYCGTGIESSIVTFSLAELGFEAAYLEGGLQRYPLDRIRSILPKDTGPTIADAAASRDTAAAIGVSAGLDLAEDAEVQASLLRAKLSQAQLELQDALRLKQEAEAAREAAERETEERLKAERSWRLLGEAARANALITEAQTTRQEIEEAKRKAESDAQSIRREAEEHARRLKAEIQVRVRARKRELESAAAANNEELARIQRLQEETEVQIRSERQRLAAESAEVEARVQEARRYREEVETALSTAEQGTQGILQAERERVAAEIERANTLLANAETMKREVEAAKGVAEAEAQRVRLQEEERINALKREVEERLRDKEQRLDTIHAVKSAELARIHKLKEDVARKLNEERQRLGREAMEAKERLAEAQRMEKALAKSRMQAAQEIEKKHQHLMNLEQGLREEVKQQLNAEQQRLDAEFAKAAEELRQAQRAREATEETRRAVAEDAQRKIAEIRANFERMHQEEQARLQVERQRLEAEALRIQGVLEQARSLKADADLARSAAEQEVARLRTMRQDASTADSKDAQQIIDGRIRNLEERATQAGAQASAAAKAEDIAATAIEVNAADLERQQAAEHRLREQVELEVEEWRQDQEAIGNSPEQQALVALRDAQIMRVNQRAAAALEQTVEHDRRLIDELRGIAVKH
ncbi:MAG: cyclic nucleotide-binding domain-containing protein [Pseudomonadota bacterium]|nr:cyclic nucleotide-binding domain-containing protein [Pseudomonadota bacterium]